MRNREYDSHALASYRCIGVNAEWHKVTRNVAITDRTIGHAAVLTPMLRFGEPLLANLRPVGRVAVSHLRADRHDG